MNELSARADASSVEELDVFNIETTFLVDGTLVRFVEGLRGSYVEAYGPGAPLLLAEVVAKIFFARWIGAGRVVQTRGRTPAEAVTALQRLLPEKTPDRSSPHLRLNGRAKSKSDR